jgi:hypothetical protein
MRIAVVADIHGNALALEAVLANIADQRGGRRRLAGREWMHGLRAGFMPLSD